MFLIFTYYLNFTIKNNKKLTFYIVFKKYFTNNTTIKA